MAKLSEISTTSLTFDEGTAPSTPAASDVVIYAKTDGLVYSKDDAGVETLMSSGSNSSGVPAGTSNPGSPASGDLFWRTDLGFLIYYDGTRWLTTNVYSIELKQEQDITTWPLAANSTVVHRGDLPLGTTYDYYLLTWYWQSYVITTNSGSAYWTTVLKKFPFPSGAASTLVTANTSADSADNWYQKASAINALLGSYSGFYTDANKTSTPGTWRFVGGHITCRAVIT